MPDSRPKRKDPDWSEVEPIVDDRAPRVVELGWGRDRRRVRLPAGARILRPPPSPSPRAWSPLIHAALDAPIGSARLAELARGPVCVLVPDDTRKAVAEHVLPVLRARLPGLEATVIVATGKHRPGACPAHADRVHDARAGDLVRVGVTAHGTEVCYPPEVVEASLRVLIGEIRPHYFAGYAGGAKALFPGVAGESGIWHNHRLKAAPGARLGRVEGNPCRHDMEAAAALAGPSFLINIIRGAHGAPVDAVAGDAVLAHRAGVARARPVFEVPAGPPADVVLVSDRAPVTSSLYQACKLLPPAGAVLRDGGTVILAAECAEGIGPLHAVNEGIYRLGSVHSLPPKHRVVLVSAQPPARVAETFADYAPDLESALAGIDGSRLLVMPRGGDLVPRSGCAGE